MLCLVASAIPCRAAEPESDPTAASVWWHTGIDGEPVVRLHFYWTSTCPHCTKARPFVATLEEKHSWIDVESYELGSAEAGRRFVELAKAANERATSVPAFIFCGRMITGFDGADGIGEELASALEECKASLDETGALPSPAAGDQESVVHLPAFGEFDLGAVSLPLVTVLLGALDSFNPCAFFVLLFLLSMLVNARSRARMLLVGALFVSVSGLAYFLFIAAWLNVFLLVGELAWITLAAGVLALTMGALNVKDYFAFREGPSLGIPDQSKPGLFRRMRGLVAAERLGTLIAGTLALAVVANAYELLCTAGFPMVFTRMLTLNELSVASYYAYVALYCVVYVIPLLTIVLAFVFTLGRRKLTEHEGRLLKLLSGVMMAALGTILLVQPKWLNHLGVMAGLLVVAILVTTAAHFTKRATAD
jgi:hypothetical protein